MSVQAVFTMLQWREPYLLIACLVPPLLVLLSRFCRRNRLDSYADRHLHYWVVVRQPSNLAGLLLSRVTVFFAAWVLLVIAAAGPRTASDTGVETTSIEQDIFIVIDVSRSMRAIDRRPDRLRRARTEIYDFLEHASNDRSRIGVIVYTSSPHLLVPLTYDRSLLSHYLSLIDRLEMPVYGSRPAQALDLAYRELKQTSHPSSIIWVTDGDHDAQTTKELDMAADKLGSGSVRLFILNAGSVEGEAIPLEGGDWLTESGQAVVSRSNVSDLERLAARAAGGYSMIRDDDSDWSLLYDNGIRLHRETQASPGEDENRYWNEYYQYALFPGLVLMYIALSGYPLARISVKYSSVVGLLVLSTALVTVTDLQADDTQLQDARARFNEGLYADALKLYETIPGYNARFGQGASAYRIGDYPHSVNQFTLAFLEAGDNRQRAASLYNLANAYFKTGNYQAAIQVYSDALLYNPGLERAQANLSLSMKLQQDIEARLAQGQAMVGRAGRGPRSQPARENIEIPGSGAVSLDDSESVGKSEDTIDQVYEALLEKGIDYATLAARGEEKTGITTRTQSLEDARLKMYLLQPRDELLWKRIFEIESGMPAPRDKPSRVSGVRPW